jgi:hypothetical protein
VTRPSLAGSIAGMSGDKDTSAGSGIDPEERPSQGGVLGGSTPHDDTSESDPVPQEEVKPGRKPDRSGS